MPDPVDDDLEFLDAGSPRRLLLLLAGVLVTAAVVALVTISRTTMSTPAAGPSTTAAPEAIAPRQPDPRPTVIAPPPTVYPRVTIRRAVAAACGAASPCRVRTGGQATLDAARRALGPVRDLHVRTIGPGRAVLVAALRRDGAQLLAVVTRPGVHVDPARLRIIPPIGVQSQSNGRDRLTVVVSGTLDAVALLAEPVIQRWLAGLSASR